MGAVREVAASQFPALDDADWRAYAEAFFVATPRGFEPQFDRAILKPFEHFDVSEKLPVLWPQFESLARAPMLAIRGELSDLLSARTLAAMAERHPRFEALTVPGQGHAPLLRDALTLERIEAFAGRCEA